MKYAVEVDSDAIIYCDVFGVARYKHVSAVTDINLAAETAVAK
jgi:hypothetical protein